MERLVCENTLCPGERVADPSLVLVPLGQSQQEPEDGEYLMTLASSDGSVRCTLENDPPPTSGPTNTVHVSCTAPVSFTDGLSTNAVVTATGPG